MVELSVSLFFIAIVCYVVSGNFQRFALIDWWKPAAICMPLAIIAGWALSYILRRAFDTKSLFWPVIIGTIISLPILTMVFYMANDYMSKPATRHIVDTIVVDRYQHTKLVRSSNKKEYLVVIKLPDNMQKKFDVRDYELMEYYSAGDVVPLNIEDGFLGIPVIKDKHLPPPQKILPQ